MGVHVAFDIGNVLVDFDVYKFTRKLSEVTGISDHAAYFFIDHLQRQQDIGITSVSHGLEYKFDKLTSAQLDELLFTWNDTITPNEMMLNFLEKLKGEGVKVAFLSNMGPEHLIHLRSTLPQMFDGVAQHISCEVGARKPSKLFFQSFCLDHDEFCISEDGRKPNFNGCVYIDDLEENLKVGKKYGFKVYNLKLDELSKLSQSKQKIELDRLKTMIFNKI